MHTMKPVSIDDDAISLEMGATILNNIDMISELHTFQTANELIEYISNESIDIAFLDIILEDIDGISLAMEVKRLQPKCKLVFISSSRDFALEAFQVYASGYLVKPIVESEVARLLMNI